MSILNKSRERQHMPYEHKIYTFVENRFLVNENAQETIELYKKNNARHSHLHFN